MNIFLIIPYGSFEFGAIIARFWVNFALFVFSFSLIFCTFFKNAVSCTFFLRILVAHLVVHFPAERSLATVC